jgi:hypothetical protein
LPPSALSIATQLFAHIVLVGIPMVLAITKSLNPAEVRFTLPPLT